MKTLSVLFLCLGLSVWAGEAAPSFDLHDGDRVVFYGDSITQNGDYARIVETYARSRFPEWKLHFYNAGVGGDTVQGGEAGNIAVRLERDVIRLKPTVVTIMLGMNDGRYRPLDSVTLAAFGDGYRALVTRLKAALPEVRLYLIRPSPFDDFSRPPDFAPGYDQVLRQLGDVVAAIGREQQA
jgi:lysophospholipase L1-like esterase